MKFLICPASGGWIVFLEHPAGVPGLVPVVDGTGALRGKKSRPLELGYSGFRKQSSRLI